MKDFTFLMKNTNLESAVWNDGQPTVNRQSTDGQSQRQYSVGTIARPLPDSVSNPCQVRVLDYPQGISGLFSGISFARVWKHVAMIFAVLMMSMANIGMAWGATETLTWALTSNTNCSGGTNVSGGSVTPVNGSTYKAGTWSFSGSKYISENKKHTNDSYWEDLSSCSASDCADPTTTARLEFPITINTGYSFNLTGISLSTFEQQSGGGPVIQVYVVQGSTKTWVGGNYTSSSKPNLNTLNINLSAGTAKVVFILGVASNQNSGRGFRFTGLTVTGTSTASGGGDTTPPTLSSSTPANAATDVAVSGNITLTFSENVTINDASKFTLSGGAGTLNTAGATVSGAIVTIPYSGLANNTTYILATAAEAVKDGSNNKNAALSNISFTTVAAADPLGSHTLTWNITTVSGSSESNVSGGTTDIGTTSTASTSTYLTSLTDLAGVGVKRTTTGKNSNTGKIETPSSYDADKYVTMTFAVASGYQFTPSSVSIKTVAVATTKDLKLEISDASGSYSVTKTSLSTSSTAAENTLDFTGCDRAFTGTVTVKIYVYGAADQYRLSTPLTIDGTVAAAAACTAPTSPSISGTTAYTEGQNISLTASATGTDGSTTYTWYKGTDWATASATTPVQAASTSGATFTKASCVVGDAGTYWCKISNGTGCEVQTSTTITVVASACDWNINYITNGLKNGNGSAVWSEDNCFEQVGSTNEWILEDFEMPNVNGQFWVGPGVFKAPGDWGHSVIADLTTIKWVYRSDKTRTNKSAVTDMTGTLNIWDNGGDDNYHIGIYPDYQITYGVDGSGGWTKVDFNHVSGTEYRTAIVTAPSGYKNNDNFKYYVGLRTKDNGNTYWGDHSSTVKMNGMSGMSSTDQAGKKGQWKMYEDSGNDNYYCSWIPVYTLTYNANGGSGAPAAQEIISDAVPCQWTLSTTQPTWADHVFLGWSTNSSATEPDAASEVADLGTPYPATGDVTLYAVWTSCSGPTINSFVPTGTTDGTYPVGTALGTLTVTASAGNGGALSYLWYQYDGGNIGAAVAAAGTNNAATYSIPNNAACVDRHYYCVVSEAGCSTTRTSDASGALTLTAASLTALECNTRYTVQDMTAGGCGTLSGTSCYSAGLSANSRFEVLGDPSKTDQAGGTPEQKTNTAQTINSISFNSFMYLKGDGQNGSTEPTCRGVKFIIPSAGRLTIYYRYGDRSKLKKEGESAVNVGTTTDGYGYDTHDVTAGTYYIYGASGGAVLIAVEYQCCSTPAAPTAFANTAVTSTTATFSITDAADAASYDLYYASGSPSTPTAGTNATENVTTKTPTITGLTASTTYKIWARSVCDASHKSSWVALGTTSFTTSEEAVLTAMECNTLYKVEDMVASSITSITSTEQYAAGLSSNTKFEVLGTGTVNATGGPMAAKNDGATISGTSFTNSLYFKGEGNKSGEIPTSRGIKFITPSAGTLDIYVKGPGSINIVKEGGTGSAIGAGDSNAKVSVEVTAGTYYLYATAGSRTLFGIKLNCCSDPVINEGTTKTSFAGGSWPQNSGHTITITATGADSYEWYRNTSATDAGATKLSETSNTLDITAGVAAGTYFYKAIAKSGACSSSTEWGWCGAMTITAVTYSITYNCNGAESGCPSNVAAASNLPSPLPTGLTKDGYDFGGWFTDSECTVAAVAGAALTGNTDLYAKWTEHIASECITITNFETSQHSNSSNKPDSQGKYIYGYKTTVDAEHAVTITTSNTNNKGQNSNADMLIHYGSSIYIYADNTTTGGTPATFSNVVSISLKIKNKHATDKSNFTIKVGSTTVANAVSLVDANNTTYTTYTYNNLAQLSGKIEIHNGGSGSTNFNFYVDDIEICTADMAACTTPTLPTATLSNQTVCEGSDIAAWDATPTNASTISGKSESVSYSWKKKGSETVLGTSATLDLGNSATESQAGTYVVTVTVSKAGYTSATVSEEIELGVTESTEVTSITADKATVYEGNSVTLTATANTTVTWQWYTCTNAAGDGESSIGGATSAAYAIASAPAAGTHYYKVKATSSCGTASLVYALVVSEASGGDCETEIWVVKAADLPEGATAATHITTPFTGGSNETASITIDGNTYTITQRTSNATGPATIVVPEGNTATLYILVKGNNGRSVILEKGGVEQWTETPEDGWQALSVDNLDAGTYSLRSSNNLGWGLLALKLCSASACSDPEVTASADNTTACVETSVTFTAANAHASATYQWQKLDGTWTDISGATASTYTIASVVAGDAGKYRVIATHDCNRTSNEVTLSVPALPNFGSTVPASVSVMQTIALSINTVEATDAVKYRWYKSADATWDAGDVEIGTDKTLIKAYASEATGSPSYYVFCRAQNACGITTSSAIAVNVTEYVEEDCATKGNEGEANFDFENTSCGSGNFPNTSTPCWNTNSKNKYLTYTAPDGKYFNKAKVTIGVSGGSTAAYGYSTDGSSWTYATLSGLTTSLAEKTINLPANVTHFRIGRNFDPSYGQTSNTFYLSKACFEYTEACTATTVTPSTSSVAYEMGGAWSNPTFSLSPAAVSGGTLTYSSSNEDIASVDDDGTVTFQDRAGTVTITAAYAGGEISSTQYCASEGSYTITVSCSDEAPKVVPASGTNMSGCNSSVTLNAKMQNGTSDFGSGTYQWFRDGEEISGATSSSYIAVQAGVYTVERTGTGGCTNLSTNHVTITSETTEPEVERLVPFQYYHVDKTYTAQMKMRHLFAVKNSGKLDGKSFKMYVSRNGGAATEVTNSNALAIWTNADGRVDTVMIDLNKLSDKYSENDELVYTCKAIDCSGNVSETYKDEITMHVIGATPTLALICSGSNKEGGTRKTGELTVGGDFLTGYNKADLCEQTGNTSFNADAEWGLYTRLKANYIVTPVNGYAIFNKLNYEPFDILLLTDYPKASKSAAAETVLDDMADLVDFRPMLSLKAHMVSKTPSKWAAKGFTTSPVHVTGGDGRIYMNIVCYAHPMFDGIKEAGDHIFRDHSDNSQIVYEVLTGPGYENSKGLQGFEIEAAENFVTIGLIHYNATATENSPSTGELTWTGGKDKNNKPNDRMLVAAVERQTNLEARLIVLAVNCGAQSKFTETGRTIVHKCLEYLLSDATDPITPVADCSFTFDNGAGALHEAEWYQDPAHCPGCTGTLGDGKWSTAANWGPDRVSIPGEFTSVRIAAPVTVDMEHAHAMEARIVEGGSIEIPAGKALEVKSTIRHFDGSEISPTEVSDIFIGSTAAGNGTLIFNNDKGDSKATVAMYTTAKTADPDPVTGIISAAASTWQYIGTPHNDVAIATYNYYDSWLYQYDTGKEEWTVIPNGGPLVPFRGYCVTHPETNHTFVMDGTLAATGTVDIDIPAGKYVVVANSWTAPIDINKLADDDLENITDKSIYFFNTGSDSEGNGVTGTAAGTYRTTPIHAAVYTGDWQIPSMQGFYVVGGSSDGTLHLDYNRHVRPADARTIIVNNPMYAPSRAKVADEEPTVLKIFARGNRYQDKLVVLEREDFTRGYDSGWDGEAWGGSDLSPMMYVIGEGRMDAVSAIPDMDGTVIGFRAGEDDIYTFHFEYDGYDEPLYLLDTDTKIFTRVLTGNIYTFMCTDKRENNRFLLTRKNAQDAPTDNADIRDEYSKPLKFLNNDKIYIYVRGVLYDITGKVVK